MDVINAMRIFTRVADAESFTRAAQQLDISVPVVTRSVAALEAHLNVRLLQRTTRQISLTDAGRTYLDGCRAILAQMEEVESNVARASSEMTGALRVVASTSFSLLRLAPVMADYRRQFPGVNLHLTLIDREVDLVEEGYDVGIVNDQMVRSESVVARELLSFTRIAVAAPAYLQEHGVPQSPEELGKHIFLAPAPEAHNHHWTFSHGDAEPVRVTLTPGFAVNSVLMLEQAARAGMGFAILPQPLAADGLESGDLVRLVEPWVASGAEVTLKLVYPSRRLINSRLRSFIEHVIRWFAHHPQGARAALPVLRD